MLRSQKGNMYGFVTHTWNPIKGRCMHFCRYCYMKRFPQRDLRLNEQEMKTDLGKENFIFVGSSTDMFAENVNNDWIMAVLKKCREADNRYLFQSKNTYRMTEVKDYIPKNSVIGTTIETNRNYKLSDAPTMKQRILWLIEMKSKFKTMITMEPLFDFDIDEMIFLIKSAKPDWVNIGADSNRGKQYSFPEPSKEKILTLIEELKKITEVKAKANLGRLLK